MYQSATITKSPPQPLFWVVTQRLRRRLCRSWLYWLHSKCRMFSEKCSIYGPSITLSLKILRISVADVVSYNNQYNTWKLAKYFINLTKKDNLPTRRWNATVTFPKKFSAKQVYHPLSQNTVSEIFRMLLVFITLLGEVSFPLYHVMVGWGFPSTGQETDAGLPSGTSIVWPSLVIVGGSEETKQTKNTE